LLSSLFLHHGILYLLPNAMFLFIFGKQVEDAFGHLLLLGIFIASGLAGTGLFYVLNRTATIPCTGSNGAVAGIVGAFWIMFPGSIFDVQVNLGWWHVTTFKSNTSVAGAAWLLWQLLVGFVPGQVPGSFILWSNIGGFVTGLIVALLLKSTLQRQLREKSGAAEPASSVTTLGL
jgi:membrane associated rhomboid family serine protease